MFRICVSLACLDYVPYPYPNRNSGGPLREHGNWLLEMEVSLLFFRVAGGVAT